MTFTYNVSHINALEVTLSSPRLSRYIKQVGGDKEKALRLYVYNVALSEAFYTPIHGLEVPLRNAMAEHLKRKLNPHWYVEGAVAFFEQPLPDMLNRAARELGEESKPINHDNMVAALNFGFWVTLLAARYENQLWRPVLRHAFPHRPKGTERKKTHGALNSVRRLRNRVAHHEPILHRDLTANHDTILKVLSWICPETRDWVAAHSRVPELLKAGP